ncbi:hypothetical protein YSA_05614 [Pseudomonas putida ND6]|uniref:Uncharacterized protein n=1 Tax=Pseudomonas putida ND6 TaxID=231023 RepID=I3UWD9_PSEPU|nr:hypothetical protein YSA_05614 [Pseudomonas putida ND6]
MHGGSPSAVHIVIEGGLCGPCEYATLALPCPSAR